MRSGWWCVAVCVAVLWPGWASAQGANTNTMKIEVSGATVEVAKPRGWVVGKVPRGSIALFQSRLDDEHGSQIEIKATPGLRAEQYKSYSETFHTALIKDGFKRSSRPKPALSNRALPGAQVFVYEVVSDETPFVLVVWEAHAGEIAWQIVGFFPVVQWDETIAVLAGVVTSFKP